MKKKMLNAKEKTRKLLVTPAYMMITLYCCGIFLLLFTILAPSGFDEQDNKFIIFLAYAFFVVIIIVCFCSATLCVQIAMVDNEKIVIKDLFRTIAIIKWSEVYSIKKQALLIQNTIFYYLVIRTEKGPEIWKGGINKKDRFPMIIYATKRNIAIIKEHWKDESF